MYYRYIKHNTYIYFYLLLFRHVVVIFTSINIGHVFFIVNILILITNIKNFFITKIIVRNFTIKYT